MTKDSISWKITHPFRIVWSILRNPKEGFYNLARFFYSMLPHSLRYITDKAARRVVYKIKGGMPSPVIGLSDDITWKEFQNKVLSKRERYKGVFIQEVIIDWGMHLYQRPQHMATALGHLGYLVIYRTRNNQVDNIRGFREVAENVWLTDCKQVDHISGAVRSVYSTSFHIDHRSLDRNVHSDRLLVYEYIDHIDAMISGTDRNVRRIRALKDFAFGGGADLVIASSRKLEAEAIQAVGKDNVLYLPNGVDVDHYRSARHETTAICNELMEFHEKYPQLVGYFGAIAPWLWYDVLDDLARKRPDLGFVFIGPDFHNSLRKLPDTENSLTLGAIDYQILPAYARYFDVCFIPFAPGEIAHTTSPLKLFEYFALEKPVVTTSFMDECVAFPEVFHGDSVQSLSHAIDKAMAVKENPAYRSRLAKLANENSWKERAKRFESVFYRSKGISIGEIQEIISRSYTDDGQTNNYYDEAYKFQEVYYWLPVPFWISQLENITSIIDIGSAYGTLLLYSGLNHKVNSMVAIDPIEYMSPSLKKRYNILSHLLDIEKDEVPKLGKFDLVIFTEVIEHLNFHPLPTLSKIIELMHSDSYFVLSTPDAEEWGRVTQYYETIDQMPAFSGQRQKRIDGHIYQYTRHELDMLLIRAGFRIEKFSYAPGVTKRHLCYLLKLDN